MHKNNTKNKNKRVVVGISGGVDSSVAAALLQKNGYEVSGVFFEFWRGKKSEEGFESAQKVAKFLDIPLRKIDATKEFKKRVVDKFIADYKNGITPNPCSVCNPQMKFKTLLKEMEKQKADFVATGHYAITSKQRAKGKKDEEIHYMQLFKAKDKTKDQSYFLYGLKQNQLSKIVFPLGKYLKSEVREIAERLNLPTAKRAESQDICFVSQKNFEDFLKKYIKNRKGKIVNEKGVHLGDHQGLHFYTIGQRRGINLGGDGPYYVISKNIKRNEVIVSNKKKRLYCNSFQVKGINWLQENLKFPLKAKVKIRYNTKETYGIIKKIKGGVFIVEMKSAQLAVTLGQVAVFYSKNNKIIGGGNII